MAAMSDEPEVDDLMVSDTAPDTDAPISGDVMSHAYSGPGEWLPIQLAAIRVDLSERQLRRKIRAADYRFRIRDRRTEVYVPMSDTAPDMVVRENETALAVSDTSDGDLARALIERLTRLTDRTVELERENAALLAQAKADRRVSDADIQRLIAEADARKSATRAERVARERAESEARELRERLEALEAERKRRRWWQFFG